MDLKEPGNRLYLVGETKNELGGSHFALVNNLAGGHVPSVETSVARRTFAALHSAIHAGFVRSCHDLSEGGLAVAVVEMAFAGGYGAQIELETAGDSELAVMLFSESNTRFVCEITPQHAANFEQALREVPLAKIGTVSDDSQLIMTTNGKSVIQSDIGTLKAAWQAPLKW
jgi:phosphoribosylformylglycinamidine synthase